MKYSADMSLPDLLYGKILFSDRPHARIVRIDPGPALAVPGVRAVVTAADAPMVRTGIYIRDKLIFARDTVRFIGEPVAAVAAVNERVAAQAVQRIRVQYEDLPAVLDPEQALASGAPLVHPDYETYATLYPYLRQGNLCMEARLSQGDVDRAFAAADFVFEDTYHTRAGSPCGPPPSS
jgi:CO/xanthine dehydrogenase Mo-binding subunit